MLVGAIATAILASDAAASSASRSPTCASTRSRPAARTGSSASSPPPSWSRCRPSRSTAGCPTPTARRRCRCWSLLSGVLSKVGAYGFLRVVLPLFPDATVHFQELILVIALASILYGSVMAFTQTNVRLIVGYSSIAQLGFITLGIFAPARRRRRRRGPADGQPRARRRAALHDHRARSPSARGPRTCARWAGMAMRAPVLAALFLIVTLATLAMPGSANFIGEFYILNGVFQAKIVFAFVAIDRGRAGGLLRAAPLPADDAQPAARGRRVARDRAPRRASCWCRWSPASSPWRSTRG